MSNTTNEKFIADHLLGGQDRVPRLGYGAMQLAGPGVIGLPDDVTGAIEVLRGAVDQGVRFFDTANAYGPRTVNQIIGRALSPFADDVVIGNKVGAWRGPAGEWTTDSGRRRVRAQVEDALLDMRTESSTLTYLRLWGDSQAPGKMRHPRTSPSRRRSVPWSSCATRARSATSGCPAPLPRCWSAPSRSRPSRPSRTASTWSIAAESRCCSPASARHRIRAVLPACVRVPRRTRGHSRGPLGGSESPPRRWPWPGCCAARQ